MVSRITTLRNLILKAKHAYYYSGEPVMTDAEYDALEDELRLLAPNDPVHALVGSSVPPGKFQHLEFIDEKSLKFWEVRLNGKTMDVRYGKIGTRVVQTQSSVDTECLNFVESSSSATFIPQCGR